MQQREITKFEIKSPFRATRVVIGYIKEIEDDCVHITTVEGEKLCLGIERP